MMPIITKVKVIQGLRLEVQFDDGEVRIKDLHEVIAIGNLGAALADASFVRRVQINHDGDSLLWPNGLEFCADSIYETAMKKPVATRVRRSAPHIYDKSV